MAEAYNLHKIINKKGKIIIGKDLTLQQAINSGLVSIYQQLVFSGWSQGAVSSNNLNTQPYSLYVYALNSGGGGYCHVYNNLTINVNVFDPTITNYKIYCKGSASCYKAGSTGANPIGINVSVGNKQIINTNVPYQVVNFDDIVEGNVLLMDTYWPTAPTSNTFALLWNIEEIGIIKLN